MSTADQSPDPDATVNDATRRAEEEEAGVGPGADRPPTEEEARLAEKAASEVDPQVGEHFSEMNRIGADVEGEGRIEGRARP